MVCKSAQIFITGGVRSGKSSHAEKLTLRIAQQENRQAVYLATAVPFDEEMSERVKKHQEDRGGQSWRTIEQSTNIIEVCKSIGEQDVLLWDCVTTWLANEMYEQETWKKPALFERRLNEGKEFLRQLSDRNIPVVIVSNELLDERAYDEEEVDFYRRQLGLFHQWIVANSTHAIEMDYGIPYCWKRDGEVN
ncbi:MAG: bifunctional adenosylcobinamide kinase/adenosylcobinamide-phosphate guanylyltransferase [Kurthia sp.]